LSLFRVNRPNFFYGRDLADRVEDYHMAKKSKQAKQSKPKKAKVEPVPKGFGTVTPYLSINGAAAAIDWYKKAFGAKEVERFPTPDGKLMNARIRIGDSNVMMSDVFPGAGSQAPDTLGNSPVTLHVYVKNVDKVWQQAVDAGAKVTMPLDNQFWGERYGQLTDPFGHHWSLSQAIKMSKAERDEKQKQAMAMFSQGEHLEAAAQTAPAQ
jgi:PhnB protein